MKASLKSSLVLLMVASLCSSGVFADYHTHPDLVMDIDSDLAYYCISGIKGFVIGYQEGFYKSSKDVS